MSVTGALGAIWLATLLLGSPLVIDGVDVTTWTPQQLWAQSDKYFHDGEYVKSVNILRRVVEVDPGDVEAYAVAAWLIWSLGDEPSARQWLKSAVAANPASSKAYSELGMHLYDRVGDAFLALPYLRRAEGLPERHLTVARLYAHCLLAVEEPWLAAAAWTRMGQANEAPPGVVTNNRRQAWASALRSDLQVRSGGVMEGPVNDSEAARLWARTTSHPDREGRPGRTVVWLAEPDGPRPVGRVTMAPRRVVNKVTWHWRTMTADQNNNGRFDDDPVLVDSDDDGIAESIPPLAQLRAQRAESISPVMRRLVAPDRYELEVDGRGWYRPTVPTVEDGAVVLVPALVIACDQGRLALRAVVRDTAKLESRELADQPLPLGVYAGNEATGPGARVILRAADLPAGRYVVALELLREGVVVDRKVCPVWVVESDGHAVRVGRPQPDDEGVWERFAAPPAPDGGPTGPPSGPPPGARRPGAV
ncbi:MAG: hypothetical protein HZB16_01305 [Armatimonadetes bacterium]|nr:hypothetical protein [Armatimonadota bacterium]